jgi:predicted nucleotidyltransferase
MSELYLFGSQARGDHKPDSDYDVFIDSVSITHARAQMIIHLLRPYAIEYGGRLDLFELHGDVMHAVYDEHDIRRVMLDKYDFHNLQVEAKPITPIELIQLMKGE